MKGSLGKAIREKGGLWEEPDGVFSIKGWSNIDLIDFSNFLGLPTEGFDLEITTLLQNMKARKK